MNHNKSRFINPMIDFAIKKIFGTLYDICLCNSETGKSFKIFCFFITLHITII